MPDNASYAPHGSWSKPGGRPAPKTTRHMQTDRSPKVHCNGCDRMVALTRLVHHQKTCVRAGRVQCSGCDQWFTVDGLRHHVAGCPGPIRVLQGHDHCTCGATKAKYGRVCFACGVKDDAIFDRLDRLTGTGKYRQLSRTIESKIRDVLEDGAVTVYVALDNQGRILVDGAGDPKC